MNHKSKLSFRSSLWLVSMALIVVLVLPVNAQSYVPAVPQTGKAYETVVLPPQSYSWRGAANVRGHGLQNPKYDSSMLDLVSAARVSTQNALTFAQSESLKLSASRVHAQVVINAQALQETIQAINAAGGEVTVVSNDLTVLQGWLPIDTLETVAADQNVYLIRRPAEPVLQEIDQVENYTTEGLSVINGAAWHAAGYRGSGVKIGIVDGGFQGYPGLLGTELPAALTIKNFVDGEVDSQVNGTTQHGTACAEIIHDIAPGATLFLVKISTDLDLQQAVAWLKDTQHVDIISTSLGWYNVSPGDGTGEFANLAQGARNAGILWVTAAGNDREAHWGGTYNDSGSPGIHNFNVGQSVDYFGPGNGNAYLIPSGYQIRVYLRWDDWANVNQDFDLYLLRWNGSSWDPVNASENVQNGQAGQTPTEYAIGITSGSDTAYGFAIQKYQATRAVNFEVFAPKIASLDEVNHARSLSNLADVPGVFTVAALDVTSPFPQEAYSSEGPTNGPGGSAVGGVKKPDIAGFANVSTASYGLVDKFNGTSSATPHVAGAAALVLSAYPSYTPAQVESFLEGRAVDMGSSGVDTVFGYGRLNMGKAPLDLLVYSVYIPLTMKAPPSAGAPVFRNP